jgi:hypothetical protein
MLHIGWDFQLLLVLSYVVIALKDLSSGTASSWSMVCHFPFSSLCLFKFEKMRRIFKVTAGNLVPSLSSVLRSIRYPEFIIVARVLLLSTNPLSLNPLLFALCVIATDLWAVVCVSLSFLKEVVTL